MPYNPVTLMSESSDLQTSSEAKARHSATFQLAASGGRP
jgi:hypothetical protein